MRSSGCTAFSQLHRYGPAGSVADQRTGALSWARMLPRLAMDQRRAAPFFVANQAATAALGHVRCRTRGRTTWRHYVRIYHSLTSDR
eukprot:Skav209051  [mRNA]  locus=scaffold2483:213682:213942:+ [translate_table: standard]